MARAIRDLAREIINTRKGNEKLSRARQVSRSYVTDTGETAEPLAIVKALNDGTAAIKQAEAASTGDRANLVSDPNRDLAWGQGWTYARDVGGADETFEPQVFDSAGPWAVLDVSDYPGRTVMTAPGYRRSAGGVQPPAGDWYGFDAPFLRVTARGLSVGARYRWSARLALLMRTLDGARIAVGDIDTGLFGGGSGGIWSPLVDGDGYNIVTTHPQIEFTATSESMPLWIAENKFQGGSGADPDITRMVWFTDTLLEALPSTDPNKAV